MDKKQRHYGTSQIKPKHFEKAFNKSGKILNIGGKSLMMVGTATGQPELVALGGSAVGASKGAKKVSKILKKVRKKHKGKKK